MSQIKLKDFAEMIRKDFSDIISILLDEYYIEIYTQRDPPDYRGRIIRLTRSNTSIFTVWHLFQKRKVKGTRINIDPNRKIEVFFRKTRKKMSPTNRYLKWILWNYYPNYETLLIDLKEFKNRIRNFLVAEIL